MPCPTSSPTISSPTIQETLTYNKANQRATQVVSDIALFNKPAGSANQVTTVSNGTANSLNQYPTAAGATLTYDTNGNLTFDGTNTFTYDAENRLLTASNAQHTSSYTYDGLGRRRTKTVDGITTVFTSAGDQEIFEYAGGSAGGLTSGQLLRHFVYADGIDEPLDMMTPSTVASPANDTHRYTVPDPGGSILALVDPTQTGSAALVSQYGYRPFGESGDSTGAYRYTSRRLDAETGLYYYRARMYSPGLGRFLQPDPIGIKGGSNLYAYVGNDPLNNTDPSGKDCVSGSGVTTCTTPAYSVNFLTPKGWQDFTSSSTNYHFYSTPANVGSASPATVQQWVANNPTPGSPSPATPFGQLNDATPAIGGNSPVNISPVLSYTTTNQLNGNPVVLNVTLPGHPLFPGVVVREVDQTAAGTVINNYGEGTSGLQSPNTLDGRVFGPSINGVWTGQVPPTQHSGSSDGGRS